MDFEDVEEGKYYRIQTIWGTDNIFYIKRRDKYSKHIICLKDGDFSNIQILIPYSEIANIEKIERW